LLGIDGRTLTKCFFRKGRRLPVIGIASLLHPVGLVDIPFFLGIIEEKRQVGWLIRSWDRAFVNFVAVPELQPRPPGDAIRGE
jgi:hypothetical protein